MIPSTKMKQAFALAEGALVLAIAAVDSALGEALGDDACAIEHPEMITAVMMFASGIYNREAPTIH